MGVGALPGHHVEYVGLAPVETAAVVFGPGSQDLHPEGGYSVYCFVGELPLVLEPAGRVGYFEGCHSHDEVVNKLNGDIQKPPIHIVEPPGEDNEVSSRGLHIVGIEYDLAEVHVGHHHPVPK